MTKFVIDRSEVNQLNSQGDNIASSANLVDEERERFTFRSFLRSALLITASVATILAAAIGWYTCHRQYGLWFFGL